MRFNTCLAISATSTIMEYFSLIFLNLDIVHNTHECCRKLLSHISNRIKCCEEQLVCYCVAGICDNSLVAKYKVRCWGCLSSCLSCIAENMTFQNH